MIYICNIFMVMFTETSAGEVIENSELQLAVYSCTEQ